MLRSQRNVLNPLLLSWSETSATCELSIACSFYPPRGAVSASRRWAGWGERGGARTMPSSEQSKLASVTSSLTAGTHRQGGQRRVRPSGVGGGGEPRTIEHLQPRARRVSLLAPRVPSSAGTGHDKTGERRTFLSTSPFSMTASCTAKKNPRGGVSASGPPGCRL